MTKINLVALGGGYVKTEKTCTPSKLTTKFLYAILG